MSNRRLIITMFFIFGFLLAAQSLGWLKWPEKIIRAGLTPLSRSTYNLGLEFKKWFSVYFSRGAIASENEQCQKNLKKYHLDQAELLLLRQENLILRSELAFLKKDKKFVMAEVIGKSSDNLSFSLILNRGAEDGIEEGNPVIAEDGFMVGKIVKIDEGLSLVRLITDNQSKIAAAVLNREKTMGIVQGQHGLSLKMSLIPQNEIVNLGDLVVTSGLEEKMPRGLVIGKIDSLQKELYEPFQSANLKPMIDLNKLTAVAILTEK